jgi:hypothetical protein
VSGEELVELAVDPLSEELVELAFKIITQTTILRVIMKIRLRSGNDAFCLLLKLPPAACAVSNSLVRPLFQGRACRWTFGSSSARKPSCPPALQNCRLARRIF